MLGYALRRFQPINSYEFKFLSPQPGTSETPSLIPSPLLLPAPRATKNIQPRIASGDRRSQNWHGARLLSTENREPVWRGGDPGDRFGPVECVTSKNEPKIISPFRGDFQQRFPTVPRPLSPKSSSRRRRSLRSIVSRFCSFHPRGHTSFSPPRPVTNIYDDYDHHHREAAAAARRASSACD